jgi:hypothetical protein
MTHDTNFSNITFIDGLKAFIMLKYVFYDDDLFYVTIFDMIKETTTNILKN